VGSSRSIHHRRRWFYVLWGVLLLGSLATLALWETPVRSGTAKLTLRLKVRELPVQTAVKVWVGPRGRWPGLAWTGQRAAASLQSVDENLILNALPLPVGYRRWVKDILPRRTADLVVLRFENPREAPRYLALPLRQDWRSGFLAPRRVMTLSMECGWKGLPTDPTGFSKPDQF